MKGAAPGQDLTYPVVRSRVTQTIDETQLVPIQGQVHPLARPESDRGVVDDSMPVEHLIVLLKRNQEQEQAAALLIDQLHNRNSSMYHHWLSAEEYGQRFGPTEDDIAKLTDWLQSKGFTIDDVPPGRTHITITGNAGMVREAFHTEIHNLFVNGGKQKGILSDPQVPAALAPITAGFLQLHSWHAHPLHHDAGVVRRHKDSAVWEEAKDRGSNPEITFAHNGNTIHAVTPQDWNTIYNANPLLQAGINGAGETIAVLEETEVVNTADVTSFRSQFGLPAYPATPSATAGGINWKYGPGNGCTAPPKPTSTDEEGEALLDVEWAGAVAPKAIIDFVACNTTGNAIGSQGTDLAASYVANYLYSTVVATSLSYGECELDAGSAGTTYYSNLFQQMAAAGITAVVSSGDQGSMTCDSSPPPPSPPPLYATHNLSTNALSSSAYDVSAGGTDFSDTYQGIVSQFWNNIDGVPYGSALSYIPEMPWGGLCSSPFLASYYQETGNTTYGTTYTPEAICNNANAKTAGLEEVVGGGGGVSSYNALPTWQSAYGIGLGGSNTSTSHRNQPDVSLFASNHKGIWGHALLYCQSDTGSACTYTNAGDAYAMAAGGTSFVAPQIAGLMAIINQSTQSRQGVANYNFYSLAAYQYGVPGSPNTNNLANCSGSMQGAMVGNDCTFRDISTTPNPSGGTLTGNIVEPCLYASVTNCWRAVATDTVGLSSVGTNPTTDNPAYQAGLGYDLATGLGSVNLYNLAAHWNLDVSFASTTTLSPNPASITSAQSTVLTATVTATGRGSLSPAAGTVSFYQSSAGVTGLLLGTATLSQACTGTPPNLTCPPATTALTVPGKRLNGGANSIVAQFSGDGANDAPSASSPVTVTVSASSQNVITLFPSALAADAATLSGTANPKGASGEIYFEYGTSTSFGSSTSYQDVVANSTVQPFSAPITGLANATTYYCHIVFYSYSTDTNYYGATLSFKTLQPVETTGLASSITSNDATLNGTVNPGGAVGNAFFQLGTSSSLSSPCTSDMLPVTSNTIAQPFSWDANGSYCITLTTGTTYYFRIVFQDYYTSNNNYGAIHSFKTLQPVETTLAATSITAVGAILNGRVNPAGAAGNAFFQWGTSSTLASPDTTTNQPATANMLAQPFSVSIGDLNIGTTYYFRIVFYDSLSSSYSYGAKQSFKTLQPVETTLAPTAITGSGATFNGTINPLGQSGYAYFYWGTSTTALNDYSSALPVAAGMTAQRFSWSVDGLSSGTTYYFQIAFEDTSDYYHPGKTLSFGTLKPVVTTLAATSVTNITATLHGTINSEGSPGNYEFQWGTSSTLASYDDSGWHPAKVGMTAQPYSWVAGSYYTLDSGTTYYFRIVFYDSDNDSYDYGHILPFTTAH
ncbi:MAG: protease pro-enzyme activation domain-containing protein [Terriglobia bacterium]